MTTPLGIRFPVSGSPVRPYEHIQNAAEDTDDLLQPLVNVVAAMLRQTAAQSIAHNTVVPITFNVEDLDTNSGHSTSSNTSRWVCPAGQGGWYECTGGVGFDGDAVNATGSREAYWSVNGATLPGSGVIIGACIASNKPTVVPVRSRLILLSPGDYLEIVAEQANKTSGAIITNVVSGPQSCISISKRMTA